MPEKQNIEWKEIWKDEYLAWICGFANAQGGALYIGKNDKGETIGLPNSHKLLEDLPNKIRDAMGIIVPVNLSTLPMSTILPALLRAGDEVLKKFANPAGRTAYHCPSMILLGTLL